METVIYQTIGLLLGVAIIKAIQFIQEWYDNRRFRKELLERTRRIKRNAKHDAEIEIMMYAIPFLLSAYRKKNELDKTKT